MSDYLWDRTGEADAEVERLEDLLGRLRNTRGAPELPLEVETHARKRAGLFSSVVFSHPARFAAAAALLLALFAGAFVLMRTSKTSGDGASARNETQSPKQMPAHEQQSAPKESHESEASNAPVLVSSPPKESATPEKMQGEQSQRDMLAVEKSSPKSQRREASPRFAVAGVQQQRRDFKTALSHGEGFDGGASNIESDAERRVRAKEQLVYALRLTGEALREVRGRTKGVAATNAFDGQSPVR